MDYLGIAKAKLEELTTALQELEESRIIAPLSGETKAMCGIDQVSESLRQIAHTLDDSTIVNRSYDYMRRLPKNYREVHNGK